MIPPRTESPEPDPRFPSGPWTGFFLQPAAPGRHWMELDLAFREGVITGEGRDKIGTFRIRGRYTAADGKCRWTKAYIGQHRLSYQGYNEGKGIWGIWEYHSAWKGGFLIWPVGMGDPTERRLAEEIDEPGPAVPILEPIEVPAEVGEPVTSEVGGHFSAIRGR